MVQVTDKTDSDELTIPIMKIRDLVLELTGKIDSIGGRVQRLESSSIKSTESRTDLENSKCTQTETDSSQHPPACHQAMELWEQYKFSQKSNTEILIEALKTLDLKSVIEHQTRQITQQGNMLNNLNRSFAKLTKIPHKSDSEKSSSTNEKNRNPNKNNPSAKRPKND